MESNNHHNHHNNANSDDENTNKSVSTPTPLSKLPFLSLPPLESLEYDCHGQESQTQPFYTIQASVPFQWEEQPGKPYPVNVEGGSPSTLDRKSLELPPRLLIALAKPRDKTSSPTTVLEGPCPSNKVSRSLLESSSFRFLKKRQQRVSFYDGSVSFSGVRGSSPNRGLLGALVVHENISKGNTWRKSGYFNFKGLTEVHEDADFVFSESDHSDCHGGAAVEMAARKRNRLSLSLAKTHFWATIYGAFKNAIPSRSTK